MELYKMNLLWDLDFANVLVIPIFFDTAYIQKFSLINMV